MITTAEKVELKALEFRKVSSGLSPAENARRHELAAKYNSDPGERAAHEQALNQSEADHYRQYVS